MNACDYVSIMVEKSERTIREWRKQLFENEGKIPESKKGKYERSGILWSCEDLNQKVIEYVRSHGNIKGKPNMTISSFCS